MLTFAASRRDYLGVLFGNRSKTLLPQDLDTNSLNTKKIFQTGTNSYNIMKEIFQNGTNILNIMKEIFQNGRPETAGES